MSTILICSISNLIVLVVLNFPIVRQLIASLQSESYGRLFTKPRIAPAQNAKDLPYENAQNYKSQTFVQCNDFTL